MTIKNTDKNVSAENIGIITNVINNNGILTFTVKNLYDDTTGDPINIDLSEHKLKLRIATSEELTRLKNSTDSQDQKDRERYIYLVNAEDDIDTEGIYEEHIWIDEKNDFEIIGSTRISLTHLLEKNNVIDNLNTETFNNNNPTALSAKQGKVLQDAKQNKTDNSLNTSDKTIVGAINENHQDIESLLGFVNPALDINFTGAKFSTSFSSPFTFTGKVLIDYGDGTIEEYTSGKINHTYESSGTYNVKIYGNITALNGYGFYACAGLTSITLSDSVTSLGTLCFSVCSGLTSITLSDSVTSLGDSCFQDCTGLTSITIPNSVISIGDLCFQNCTGLTSITLSNSVTSLGGNCFDNCTGLTSITLPNNSISFGFDCFIGCTNLTTLILKWTDSTNILTYDTITGLDSSISSFSIPNGTTELYIAKGYPSAELIERTTYDELGDVPIVPSDVSDLSDTQNIFIQSTDIDYINTTVTYTDGTTETVKLLKYIE